LPLIRTILFLCLLSLPAAEAEADQDAIGLQTVPPLTEVRPFSEPVRIALEVPDGSGNPVKEGWLKLRLHAPNSRWLFSTDFPRVEGTLLSEMVLPVSQGKVEWEYTFPIRGVYRLEVESVGEEGRGIKKVFELQIKESRLNLLFLAGFIAALFLVGFIAGRLFTGPR